MALERGKITRRYPGPSLDMDEDGDPKMEGFAERLSADMAREDQRVNIAPSHVRRWREKQAREKKKGKGEEE